MSHNSLIWKSNNKYMKDCDKDKNSSYLKYCDVLLGNVAKASSK